MNESLFCFFLLTAFYPAISQTSYSIPVGDLSLNSRKLIQTNKINKESLYYYTGTKKKIRDSIGLGYKEYDSMGNVIKWGNSNPNLPSATTIKYEYNQDSRIHRILTDRPYPGAKTEIKEYTYDSTGKIDMIFTYNKDTNYVFMEKRIYNENNQLISTFTKEGKNDFHLKSRFYYSEDGLSQKEENYSSKEVLEKSYITEWDTIKGKRTTYLEDKKEEKHLTEIALFDRSGRMIELSGSGTENFYRWAWTVRPKTITHLADLKFIYSPDGTLFETDVYEDNNKTQIYRHYYTKK